MSWMLRSAITFVVVMLVIGGCSNPKDTGLPKGPTPEPTAQKGVVEATASNSFEPKEVTIKLGEEITWNFTPLHNAEADDGTFNSHPGCSAAAQSNCSKTDDTFKFKFTRAGEYEYFCVIHGSKGSFERGSGMAGRITVQG